MFRLPLVTNDEDITYDQFWGAVILYHCRPHLANRRIVGASQVYFFKVKFSNASIIRITELFTWSALIYEIRKLKEKSSEHIKPELILSILQPYDKSCELEESSIEEFKKCTNGTFISVRILLPRQSTIKKTIEVVTFDKNENLNVATFFSIFEKDQNGIAPPFPYDIEYLPPGVVNICVDNTDYAESSSAEWLVSGLFPKLIKWAQEYETQKDIKNSLCLVNIDLYCNLYHQLKEKHGKNLVEMWPEKTDPYKYVYEDIAIAAYLISLWTKDNADYKPSFVDLGCGNGLLVYILNEAGYKGYGVDIRKRKIWDFYPEPSNLKVQSLTPSDNSLFPDADWIIGNHSDELTPWIPVITLRSSNKSNFFLLPCCSYDFDGKKFQRENTSKSQYADYLDYVEKICKICGFDVARDKLRIPSTKRTCLVSQRRTYKPKQLPEIEKKLTDLIRSKTGHSPCENGNWVDNYQTRAAEEEVRNCTKIDKSVIQVILQQVLKELLKGGSFSIKANGKQWNTGKMISFRSLAKSIDRDYLKKLKNECGGLQTLLKNHRYLFLIEDGLIKLNIPPVFDAKNSKHRSKTCWFFENHPDGCFHESYECSYKH